MYRHNRPSSISPWTENAAKAVIVPTKRGEIFVLDRETGELLTEVTERAVPQTDLENEWSSPTQPFSTGMPSFAYPMITESKMMGVTPFDQIACRKALLELRYEGPMTPPSERGTLLYPGPGWRHELGQRCRGRTTAVDGG